MADGVPVGPGGGGPTSVVTIAADEIAGKKYQRMKLIHGIDGVNGGDVSSTNPLPVLVADLENYKISDVAIGDPISYYGYVDKDENWYIQQDTGGTAFRYFKGSTDYTTNWTNRAGLAYDYFYAIF